MKERVCNECKQDLFGRKDQKFCSDYCRNTYNNRLNEDSTKYIRRINGILRKNRRILEGLNPEGKKNFRRNSIGRRRFLIFIITPICTRLKMAISIIFATNKDI